MSNQHYKSSTYTLQDSVGYQIKRCESLLSEILEPVLEGQGFTMVQYQILVWLRDGKVINPMDISKQFQKTSGVFTRVIDRSEERGFLKRVRREGKDRRKVDLEITVAGLDIIGNLIPRVVDKLNLALADFSTTEVKEFDRLLFKFNATMQLALEGKATVDA